MQINDGFVDISHIDVLVPLWFGFLLVMESGYSCRISHRQGKEILAKMLELADSNRSRRDKMSEGLADAIGGIISVRMGTPQAVEDDGKGPFENCDVFEKD